MLAALAPASRCAATQRLCAGASSTAQAKDGKGRTVAWELGSVQGLQPELGGP